MREFILKASKAVTAPIFRLSDLPGSGGRIDLVCRCVTAALWLSHKLRKDVLFRTVLEGPPSPPRLLTFDSNRLRGLSPDERNVASHIRAALRKGEKLKLGESVQVSAGIVIAKRSWESLVKEKVKQLQVVYLHPRGRDIKEVEFENRVCFVLGDHLGLSKKNEKLLRRLGVARVSIGPFTYFSSACITICHYELDRRGLN